MKTLIYCVDPSWKVSLKRGVDTFVPKCQHQKIVEIAGFLKFKTFPYETLLVTFLLFTSLLDFGKNVCGQKIWVKFSFSTKNAHVICNIELEDFLAKLNFKQNFFQYQEFLWRNNGGEIFLAQRKMHISFVILNLDRLFGNNSTANKISFSAKGSVKRQLQRNSGKTNKARTNNHVS